MAEHSSPDVPANDAGDLPEPVVWFCGKCASRNDARFSVRCGRCGEGEAPALVAAEGKLQRARELVAELARVVQ